MNGSSTSRADRQPVECRERVLRRERGDERLDPDRLEDEVGVVDRRPQERDVEHPLEQTLDLRRREHLAAELEAHARQAARAAPWPGAGAARRSSSP